MHEYSIVQALMARAEQEAAERGASRVRRLEVRIGELAGVDVDLLLTAYETFRVRSICDDAELAVTRVTAEWRCPHCGELIEPGCVLRCMRCDMPAQLSAGDEIYLDRIEMEVRDV
jgi:hydrogenase nickel insertion protein HypA